MHKIPTLFVRNPEDRRYVTPEVTPGCEWVIAGEGITTRKYDGTCVQLTKDGSWWARREVKADKASPEGYVTTGFDEITGKRVGWEPIAQSSFAKYHAEALATQPVITLTGTYELVGPKINGNPEGMGGHFLVRHGSAEQVAGVPRDFYELKAWLPTFDGEGIVWHLSQMDGNLSMVKLKRKDFPKGA